MLWKRLGKLNPRIVDVILVALLIPISLGSAGRHHSLAAVILFGLVQSLPLLARRRRPLLVLGVVLVATLAADVVLRDSNAAPAWLALYTVAAHGSRRISLRAGAVTLLVLLTPVALDHHRWGSIVPAIVLAVAAWTLGDNLRTRRAYLRELADRAERLEREREENIRRAAAEEQARIARELHDVIAHNVSVMVVQAAAANDVFDAQPEQAREALLAIERTGRSALAELRRLLGVVREPAGPEFAPQPGLSGLSALVDGVRAAGLPVELHVDGELADLPAGLGLSAYRIVQEALTNTLKHADASRAEVGIRRTAETVELEIVDDGRAAGPGEGGGQGLIGMRERASLVGGDVEAGPIPGGGFRVRARLPL